MKPIPERTETYADYKKKVTAMLNTEFRDFTAKISAQSLTQQDKQEYVKQKINELLKLV